jgi:alpha-amylase
MNHIRLKAFRLGRLFALMGAALTTATAASAKSPDTFVHLFEWSWDDIAHECTAFLGPKGFSAVQISPPNEHIRGTEWWTRYQPVSYKIFSRSGDEEAFRRMVETCHGAGVKIYADAVINHTADQERGPGVGGTPYRRKDHPTIPYHAEHYHADCKIEPDDYNNNADKVRNCQLSNLPDLNTGLPHVQDKLAGYLRHLGDDLRVDGIRIDGAKHMAPGELQVILEKAGRPWAFLEVIGARGEVVQPSQYTYLAHVTDFKYGTDIAQKFRGDFNGNLSQLRTLGETWDLVPSDKAVVFIDNHDRERGHGGGGNLTYKDGARYNLANVFMLAFPYGYPKVMSGYKFTDGDAGPPSGGGCANDDWVCQHRWGNIANMVAYRKAVVGSCPTGGDSKVDHWWSNGANQIAFGCADKGFVVIDNQQDGLEQRLRTGLPAGRYCNILSRDNPCGGEIITVDDQGFAEFNVRGMNASALYVGAQPEERRTGNDSGKPSAAGDLHKARNCLASTISRLRGLQMSSFTSPDKHFAEA